MSLVLDEQMYKSFLKDGVKDDTARAFGHFFAFADGRCELENYLREKFEAIGLLDPDGVTIHMDNPEDSIEWIMLVQVFEGKIERMWNEKKQCFQYKNTPDGEAEAIRLIKELSKNV